MSALQLLRNIIFYSFLYPVTLLVVSLMLVTSFLGYYFSVKLVRIWARCYLCLIKHICGLDYTVTGLDSIPKNACIFMSNHQSAWETIFMQAYLPPQCWVIKKELLWIPFFGWGLALLKPIAIDRKKGNSFEKILAIGWQALKKGRSIVIFPEGTRVAWGRTARFRRSGAVLAIKTKFPFVLMAHNAGKFFPRGSFVKRPGKIKVVFSSSMFAEEDDTADSLTTKIQAWIENAKAELD